ncbi:MAG: hypothetical protein HY695_25670 [Deltaproteobacteria bacterium]|nr:hypothetical protein [Deltaproteobacteria bacterium]
MQREVGPRHPLYGKSVSAIGRRFDRDDYLYKLLDGSGRVAVVHLTWHGETERDPIGPATEIFESFDEWVEKGMETDNAEWSAG